LRVSIVASSALGAGTISLGNVVASVPVSAPYGAKDLLHFSGVTLNQGATPVRLGDGLHVVAFVGDTTGNGSYTTLDVSELQRVLLREDSGFGAWPVVDPIIVGDVSGDKQLTSLDALRLALQVAGTPQAPIPPIPSGQPALVFAGADPTVTLGSVTAMAGEQASVPVRIDSAAGLESIQMTVRYDAAKLAFAGVAETALTASFVYEVVHSEPGVLSIDVSAAAPLTSGSGVLFNLKFDVAASARGPIALDFAAASLNDTHLTLDPQPKPGADPTDGVIDVVAPPTVDPHERAAVVPTLSFNLAAQAFSLGDSRSSWLNDWVADSSSTDADNKSNSWTISANRRR